MLTDASSLSLSLSAVYVGLQGGSSRHKIHRTTEKASFLALTHAAVPSLTLICATPRSVTSGVFGLSIISIIQGDEMRKWNVLMVSQVVFGWVVGNLFPTNGGKITLPMFMLAGGTWSDLNCLLMTQSSEDGGSTDGVTESMTNQYIV